MGVAVVWLQRWQMGAKISEGRDDGQEEHGRAQAAVVVMMPEPVPAPPGAAGGTPLF